MRTLSIGSRATHVVKDPQTPRCRRLVIIVPCRRLVRDRSNLGGSHTFCSEMKGPGSAILPSSRSCSFKAVLDSDERCLFPRLTSALPSRLDASVSGDSARFERALRKPELAPSIEVRERVVLLHC